MQRSFDQNILPEKSEALHSHAMLCWNMQRSFDWSEHPSWEIRGTALTFYVGTCKGHLTDQNILPEKSEALHSHSMLEHAKIIWLIRTSSLRNQRHCTHILCWNMQKSFDWSEYPSWEIRDTALTSYIGTCKSHLTDQNIFPEKSEALHLHPMLEHAKVIWLIRTLFLGNQRHCTHKLYWNMQRSFDWSEHPFWEIRGTALTYYVRTCKSHLTDQNILPEKSEALHSHPMLEHAKVIWLIRTSFLKNQRHCTHMLCYVEHAKVIWLIRTFFLKNQRHCTHNLYWNMQRSFNWSEHPFWEIRGTALTFYVGTCKSHLTDQNILPEKSEALHSHTILEHAKVIWLIKTSFLRNQRHCTHTLCYVEHVKVIWLIRTSFLRNQRHCTHSLCWNMQRSFDWSEHPFWEIRGTALTSYVGTCKGHLTDQNILSEKSEALHSHAMLEHAKVIWLIKTSFLRNQRHCTHILCWNMQRLFDWSKHPS